MAPPSTPAHPRFLLQKSQKPKSAGPLQDGQQQFASTPRFNVSKTTPRQTAPSLQPPPFSTSAQPSRFKATQYEPLSDSIDTSPISSDLPRGGDRGPTSLNESIEVDSLSPSASPLALRDDAERPSKRRRVSISPVLDATPDDDESHEPMILDDETVQFDDTPLSDDEQTSSLAGEQRMDSEEPSSPVNVLTRHPKFLSAPRFKPTEAVEGDPSRPPLPDAFSPQRRGAKYVAGGLAAEVRDWLVQVKGASEYDRPVGESVRFTVDQVKTCHPGGMCVISGSEIETENEGDGVQVHIGAYEEQPVKVILAGDGRMDGLRGKSVVARGKTLSLFQPMWDIALEDHGHFAVACDWAGEDLRMGED